MMNKSLAYFKTAPILNVLVCRQYIFCILFGIWPLPEIILIRYIYLILGAVISVYLIHKNYFLLLRKQALSIYLLALLFVCALFHLLFG